MFRVGDKVRIGQTGLPGFDYGVVLEVKGDSVLVDWKVAQARYWESASSLRAH